MLPTKEEQDKKLEELQRLINDRQTNLLYKEAMTLYAKWYAEQVIKHCVEVVEITTSGKSINSNRYGMQYYDDQNDCYVIVDKDSILDIIKEL